MHLFGTVVKEHLHVVAQLRATHDAVVAEEQALVLEQCAVGNEFHLGHEVAHLLVGGRETAGPGGRVFADGALVGALHTIGIAQGHSNSRIGNAANAVHRCVVLAAHHFAHLVAHVLHVAALVGRSGETVVHPQEGTNLHLLFGLAHLLDAIVAQTDDFAGTHEMLNAVVQIDKGGRLGSGGVCAVLLANDDGRASPLVAGGNDAVFGEQEHGAGTLDVAIDILNAVHEILALDNQERDEFGGIRLARREFGKVHSFVEQLRGQLVQVLNLGHGDDGEAP